MTGFIIFLVLVFVCHQVGLWLIFRKAGENPVLSLIPVYNYYILIKISNRPWWWVILLFIPIVQFITNYNIRTDTIKNFGKLRFIDEVLGVMFFSFYLVYLGLDKNTKYIGPSHTEEFKKKYPVRKTTIRDWAEALFFAAVVATQVRATYIEAYTIPTASMERSLLIGDFLFVSKTHYGVRIPMTPVAFPFAHHTMPLIGGKAYVDFIKFPYYRLPALEKIENNDIVVFNFPEGDTVILSKQNESYYGITYEKYLEVRSNHNVTNETVRNNYLRSNPYTVRPLDKMDNYIKRCVAIAGDSIEIRNSVVYINGEVLKEPNNMAHLYQLPITSPLNPQNATAKKRLTKLEVSIDPSNFNYYRISNDSAGIVISLTNAAHNSLKASGAMEGAKRLIRGAGDWEPSTFPRNSMFKWNKDNFGPLWVPKEGATITLTKENYPLYERAIRVYEHNPDFTISGDTFILNGQPVTTYTFKQDYYFMMGDNRDNSLDSRFWGFVPFDHVVGKPVFIWLSLDYEQKSFFDKIRWNRLFRVIKFD
ncbi:MAG TPA: signal peptidase I [Bacteroidia bacterium]|nr:signal peptidase I [Bacteroidia bacterium]